MTSRRLFLATIAAGAVAGVAAAVPAQAEPWDRIPEPRREFAPGPRRGYLWEPGHWHWNGRQYIWLSGHFVPAREEYHHYVPGVWFQRGQHWEWVPGHWE